MIGNVPLVPLTKMLNDKFGDDQQVKEGSDDKLDGSVRFCCSSYGFLRRSAVYVCYLLKSEPRLVPTWC